MYAFVTHLMGNMEPLQRPEQQLAALAAERDGADHEHGSVSVTNADEWCLSLHCASYPHPPAGSLAGGPNSALEDPVASRTLPGCAPHKCYLDDIESFSTNEVAINWNSALVWTAAWLSDHAQ